MKQVHTTTELDEALVYQALLREHGIESNLENERTAFLVIDIPTSVVPFVLTVVDDQVGAAQEILEASRARRLEEDEPPSAEPAHETDALERKVEEARRSRRRRWWVILILYFFAPALGLAWFFGGDWESGLAALVFIAAVPVAAWVLAHRHGPKARHS